MAVQSFAELMHKLKEVHEQEMEAWQEKVQELTNKKNCDGKRLEELYNRNQQMREQQKILTENIKQLENMLRAGLCDRCTVTQEIAKKRQQEYESSQLQSLQHISLLANEVSALMKENEKLKGQVKRLRGQIEQHNGHSEEARSPEIKRSPDPVAIDPAHLSRVSAGVTLEQPTAGGRIAPATVVKSESERSQTTETVSERTEATDKGAPHEQLLGWRGEYPFKSNNLPTLLDTANPTTWKERAVSLNSLPSPTSPTLPSHLQLLKKNPFLFEERREHVSIPLRPHPIRWPPPEHTDWVSIATVGSGAHPNMSQGSSMLRFPSMTTPTEHLAPRPRPQGSSDTGLWPERPTRPPRRRQSELAESRDRRTTVSVIAPPSWRASVVQPKRIFGENLREQGEEIPLDLSNGGGSKIKETESTETIQNQTRSDMTSSASSSSSSPPAPFSSPSSAQYISSPQSDTQARDPQPQREETWERPMEEGDEENEKKESVEFSENPKVPTLTISLRPVVVLESLKTTGQKELDMERSSSPQEQEEEEENNQSAARKRSGQDDEALSRRPLKEKRIRLTLNPQGPNHGESDQG